jgi:hypothetical protein
LCAFLLCTQGCGHIMRPAFPAPSDLGRVFLHNSDASRRENAAVYLDVIACDKRKAFAQGNASDEVIHSCFLVALWIASLALAMTVWLFEI